MWNVTRSSASSISISATFVYDERLCDLPCSKSARRLGREVAAEHDVLARLGDRTSVRRLEDVVRRQHEQTALELGLERQRNVHGHLVTVEVRVERGFRPRSTSPGPSTASPCSSRGAGRWPAGPGGLAHHGQGTGDTAEQALRMALRPSSPRHRSSSFAMTYAVTLIPGDGIGPEITEQTVVLSKRPASPFHGMCSRPAWRR